MKTAVDERAWILLGGGMLKIFLYKRKWTRTHDGRHDQPDLLGSISKAYTSVWANSLVFAERSEDRAQIFASCAKRRSRPISSTPSVPSGGATGSLMVRQHVRNLSLPYPHRPDRLLW